MKVIYGVGGLGSAGAAPKVVAVGVFDGVHRGHRSVLRRVVAEARRKRLKSAVVTFSFHPSHLFDPLKKIPHLTTLEHKLRLIAQEGIDQCYVIHFDRAFARLSARAFIEDILLRRIGMVSLYVGEDFVFGSRKEGDADYLKRLALQDDFALHILRRVRIRRKIVSSTLIRLLVRQGDVAAARVFLGRPVTLAGRVIRGEGRGRRLGFPTANIESGGEILPADGIYAGLCRIEKRSVPCAIYIGHKPTFRNASAGPTIEAFLMGFKKNLYGKILEVSLLQRLRPDKKFASEQELVSAITGDVRAATKVLGNA